MLSTAKIGLVTFLLVVPALFGAATTIGRPASVGSASLDSKGLERPSSSAGAGLSPCSVGAGCEAAAAIGPRIRDATELPSPLAGGPPSILATFDPANGSLTPGFTPTPAGASVAAVVLDTSTGAYFTAESDSSALLVTNSASGSLSDAIPVGSGPTALAFDPKSGAIFVADFLAGDVTVVNGTSQTVTTTIPLGNTSHPNALALDATTGELYVAELGPYQSGCCGTTVAVINATTDRWVGNFTAGDGPSSVTVDSALGSIWVTDTWAGDVDELSAVSGSLLASVPTVSYPVASALDPGRGILLVEGGWDDVNESSLINASSATNLANVSTPDPDASLGSEQVLFDGIRNRFETVSGDGWIDEIDPLNETLGARRIVGGCLAALAQGAKASFVAADSCTNRLISVDGSGLAVDSRYSLGAFPTQMAWDPNTDQVFYADAANRSIAVLSGENLTAMGTLPFNATVNGMVFVPPGNQLWVTVPEGVVIVAASTGVVLDRILLNCDNGIGPTGVAFDASTGDVIVSVLLDAGGAACANDTLVAYNATTFGVDWTSVIDNTSASRTDVNSVLAIPSSPFVYTTDAFLDRVVRVYGVNGTVAGTEAAGADPNELGYDPVADAVVVADGDAHNLTIFNATSGELRTTIPLFGSPPQGMTFDTVGGQLYVIGLSSSRSSRIYTLNGTAPSLDLGGTTEVVESIDTFTLYDPAKDWLLWSTGTAGSILVLGGPLFDVSATGSPTPVYAGSPWTLNVTAEGGEQPYSYNYSGLPAGCLSQDAPTISCVPEAPGNSTVNVALTDSSGLRAFVGFRVDVLPTPIQVAISRVSTETTTRVNSTLDATATITTSVDVTLVRSLETFSWSCEPASCTLNTTDGPFVSAFFSEVGNATLRVVTNYSGSQANGSLQIQVLPAVGPSPPAASAPTSLWPYAVLAGAVLALAIFVVLWRYRGRSSPPVP